MLFGDSVVLVSAGDGMREPTSAFLYVYVADTDRTFQQAVDCGAQIVQRPLDTAYGDRRATIKDRWGNTWQIATFRER